MSLGACRSGKAGSRGWPGLPLPEGRIAGLAGTALPEGRIAGWPGLPAGARPRSASSYAEPVGSSPRLSDSQIAALSGRRFPRSPARTAGAGADADAGAADADAGADAADADAGASYRLDMTGSSSARHVTSTPAAMIASAPAKATPRQGKAANTTWDGKPDTPVPAAWP